MEGRAGDLAGAGAGLARRDFHHPQHLLRAHEEARDEGSGSSTEAAGRGRRRPGGLRGRQAQLPLGERDGPQQRRDGQGRGGQHRQGAYRPEPRAHHVRHKVPADAVGVAEAAAEAAAGPAADGHPGAAGRSPLPGREQRRQGGAEGIYISLSLYIYIYTYIYIYIYIFRERGTTLESRDCPVWCAALTGSRLPSQAPAAP